MHFRSAGFSVAALALLALPSQANAAIQFASSGDGQFDAWRNAFADRAVQSGRNPQVVERLLTGIVPSLDVIAQDQNQPEFTRPPWEYVSQGVSATRIAKGIQLRQQYGETFAAIEAKYGVDGDVIAGIWAVETNFGTFPLRYNAVQSLATLASEGRRRAQFEGFLLALIEMVERGYVGPEELKSSWAGAMGQPQFMPDIYLQYAQDWSGDGRRDIWNDVGDVLASIAQYLAQRGWAKGQPVFSEVNLPPNFNYSLADEIARPLDAWRSIGIAPRDGIWPEQNMRLPAELWLPAGKEGPALLLFGNFQAIKAYNPSDRYALTVALLARGFAGRPLLQAPWPIDAGYLNRDEMIELQTLLASRGHSPGKIDGTFGTATRRAIRSYQLEKLLDADGYPTPDLLARLRGGAAPILAATGEDGQATQAPPPPRPEPPALKTRPTSSALLDYRGIRTLQRYLTQLGYRIGRADGSAGPKTRAAVRALETKLGYKPTGRLDAFILARAKKAAAR